MYVWSGELAVAHENAVGSDNDVFVENAVFSLQSNETSPSSFSFSNKIFLAGLSSGSESVFKLAAGSAQVTQPIGIDNNARIFMPVSGSQLLLDDLSPSSPSNMLTGVELGGCQSSSPCQLVIEGPGVAGETAILKTFRHGLGVSGTTAADTKSDGISLFTNYGEDTSLVNMKLTDNIIFRLSGDSSFGHLRLSSSAAATIKSIMQNPDLPRYQLGIYPHSQIIKSTTAG